MYQWNVHSRALLLQPLTEAKETLDSVPTELSLYAKAFCSIAPLLVPIWTVVPPPCPPTHVPGSSPDWPLD